MTNGNPKGHPSRIRDDRADTRDAPLAQIAAWQAPLHDVQVHFTPNFLKVP